MIVRRSARIAPVCLIVFFVLFASHSALCRAGKHLPQTANTLSTLTLPMTDAGGSPVVGIVCDNLPDLPDPLRNYLVLSLPASLRDVSLAWTLANANPKDDFKGQNAAPNVGTLRRDGARLIYVPPDEFNANPEPQRLSEIRRETRRIITLTVRRNGGNGAGELVVQQPIVLARPPLIAVHGINSDASSPTWSGKDRLVSRLKDMGIPVVLVNHGRQDFRYRNPLETPALEFFGNGPAEEGAQQVAAAVTQTLDAIRQNEHLAIRRVDLLGYSYGGLIARWYLHTFRADPQAQNSVRWYVRSSNTGASKPLYSLDSKWYAAQMQRKEEEKRRGEGEKSEQNNENHLSTINYQLSTKELSTFPPVRKLITVASMWRGVPLCNYVNEIHAPSEGRIRLADAPLLGYKIGDIIDLNLAPLLPTRVPSMEVMAVNSPWLTALDTYRAEGLRKPFLDDVAYGSVAGDDNAFLRLPGSGARVDPYSILRLAQAPSWYPYLALEQHPGSLHNYSDGLVPLWSAVCAPNFEGFQPSRIVQANHDSILSNKKALEYVACALNHRAWLPMGKMLNSYWGQALSSRDLASLPDATLPQNSPIPDYAFGPPQAASASVGTRHAWTFAPGEMAPRLQNQLYPQMGLLGRIAPDALREINLVRVENITQDSAIVVWHTAAEINGRVTVTHWEPVNFGSYADVEVSCAIEPMGYCVTRDHRVRISHLQPNTTYHVIATSEAYQDPDVVITLRSEPVRFTTK